MTEILTDDELAAVVENAAGNPWRPFVRALAQNMDASYSENPDGSCRIDIGGPGQFADRLMKSVWHRSQVAGAPLPVLPTDYRFTPNEGMGCFLEFRAADFRTWWERP